jgi:hypothetical protein
MRFHRNSQPDNGVFSIADGGVFVVHELSETLDAPLVAGQKVTLLVGERVTLRLTVRGQVKWVLARRPAASTATVDAGRLCPDAPGLYVVRVTIGGDWWREIMVVAYPRQALDRVGFGKVEASGPPSMPLERRLRLRAITNDPRATPERVIACLEPPGDPCLGLAGALLGEEILNVTHYGGFA